MMEKSSQLDFFWLKILDKFKGRQIVEGKRNEISKICHRCGGIKNQHPLNPLYIHNLCYLKENKSYVCRYCLEYGAINLYKNILVNMYYVLKEHYYNDKKRDFFFIKSIVDDYSFNKKIIRMLVNKDKYLEKIYNYFGKEEYEKIYGEYKNSSKIIPYTLGRNMFGDSNYDFDKIKDSYIFQEHHKKNITEDSFFLGDKSKERYYMINIFRKKTSKMFWAIYLLNKIEDINNKYYLPTELILEIIYNTMYWLPKIYY